MPQPPRFRSACSNHHFVRMKQRGLPPFIRPGSVLAVNSSDTHLSRADTQQSLDHPLFLIETREDFLVSSLEAHDHLIYAVPYASKGASPQVFRERDVHIVGRAMKLLFYLLTTHSPLRSILSESRTTSTSRNNRGEAQTPCYTT